MSTTSKDRHRESQIREEYRIAAKHYHNTLEGGNTLAKLFREIERLGAVNVLAAGDK